MTDNSKAEGSGTSSSSVESSAESRFPEKDALSNLRHSLRTPLNQIIGYSEMLQEEAEELDLSDYIPDLQKIHTAGGQLLALVNDGLAPWKIETGKIDLEMMRHEMRTPLNLIMGYNELLQEEAQDQGRKDLLPDLQKIQAAAKNLLDFFCGPNFPTTLELAAKSKPGVSAKATVGKSLFPPPESSDEPRSITDTGCILVVDDDALNRDMLARRLERRGYQALLADSGTAGIQILKNQKVDLVLLDVVMPELDGLQTLKVIKSDKLLRHIPVVMLSALDELEGAVKCIEVGAEDYVPKPFNPVLLHARIINALEKKRLRDQEQAHIEQLEIEREKSERLLLNILPKSIADRLKQGETIIADTFPEATVLFADLVDFSKHSASISAPEMVQLLNDIFSAFDWLAELHTLEKIKTIGDAYMVVGGLPIARTDHVAVVAEMALEMQKVVTRYRVGSGPPFSIRIGVSTGPVTAGIIGRKKFIYDLWGDTVNTASRMEALAQPGTIQVAPSTYERLRNKYSFEKRGPIDVKGKGVMDTYLLTGRISRATA